VYQKRAAVAARRPKNFRAPASENRTQYDHACTPNVEEVLPYTEKDSLVRPFGYAAVVPWVGGLTTITRGPSRRMRARRGKLRALVSVRMLASDEEVLPNGSRTVLKGDRLIVASARFLDAVLVTRDGAILDYAMAARAVRVLDPGR